MRLGWTHASVVWSCVFCARGESLDNWTRRESSTNPVACVRFCKDRFIAVGLAGRISTSFDGTQWNPQTSGVSANLYGVTYGGELLGGYFVAVGNQTILISRDATNWTKVPNTSRVVLHDVAASGTTLVAVGSQYGINTNEPNVLHTSSIPPTNWTRVRVGFQSSCFGGPPSFTAANFERVVYAEGQFLAVGDICTGIWTSLSGGTWQNRGGQGSQYFSGVAYGNGRYVAVGREGDPFVSTNGGVSWFGMRVHPLYSMYYFFDDICFANGRFVAVDGNHVLSGLTGTNWTIRDVSGTNWTPVFGTVTYGAGTFVAAGPSSDVYYGIYQSDSVTAQMSGRKTSNDGPFQITLALEPGQPFAVEASSNLVQWSELARGTNSTAASLLIPDWAATNNPRRFYRAVFP
jgi:hypothetical protein